MDSESSSDVVYKGLWTDYERGRVRGLMVTVDNRSASALLAFLAMLVLFAANRAWRILGFLLHTALRRSPSLHREPQVVFRNSETAGGAFLSLIPLIWKPRSGQRLRLVLLAAVVFLHYAAFIIAGVFTSAISRGKLVLSQQTEGCGVWVQKDPVRFDQEPGLAKLTDNELALNATLDAENYVRNCYSSQAGGIVTCDSLRTSHIEIETGMTDCPFLRSEACEIADKSKAGFYMDTGKVSLAALGYNLPQSLQIFVRRRTVCAPIPTQPFLYSAANRNATLAKAFGEENLSSVTGIEDIAVFAHTRLPSGENGTSFQRITTPDYELHTALSLNSTTTFPLLYTSDPSTTLSVISLYGAMVVFLSPNTDPLFRAPAERRVPRGGLPDSVTYSMDRIINSVACVESSQFCSDLSGTCTPFTGLWSRDTISRVLGTEFWGGNLTLRSLPTASFMINSLPRTSLYEAISNRGYSALQAARFYRLRNQLKLEKEQWKVELTYWFRVGLARLQLAGPRAVKTPSVDRSRVVNQWDVVGAQDTTDTGNDTLRFIKSVCGDIKFRSPKYETLSATGIFVIVAFTVVVTVVSYADMAIAEGKRWLPGKAWIGRVFDRWWADENLELLKEAEERKEGNGEEKGWVQGKDEEHDSGRVGKHPDQDSSQAVVQ